MFLLKNEHDLLNAFRPRDRETVELPADLHFPRAVRDYLAWVEPAGTRVFVVFQEPVSKKPLGIAFRRDSGPADGRGPLMCDWCHSMGGRGDIGLLSTDRNSKRRVGVCLCLDLRCAEKLEDAADRAGRSAREPIQRMVERMVRFAREGLGIEQVP